MSNYIKESANRVIQLCEQYDNETLKTRKVYILNQILIELNNIEKECLPKENKKIISTIEKEKLMKELNISTLRLSEDKIIKKEYKKNFYGLISNLFFESVSEKIQRLFPNYSENIRKKLLSSGLNIISTTYMSIQIFTLLLSLFLGSAIGIIIFYMYSTIYGLLLGVFLLLITILIFNFYPNLLIYFRNRNLEKEYPFIVSYLSALSNSHIHGITLFEILLKSNNSKGLKTDLHRLINYVKVFSIPLPEALKLVATNNPSYNTKILFFELAKELEEKKDLKKYLDSKSREAINKYKAFQSSPFKKFLNINSEILKYFKFKSYYFVTISLAVVILAVSLYYNTEFNLILIGTIILINLLIIIPILRDLYNNWILNKNLETQFYYFVKDLHNTKNLLQINKDYKELNHNVKKLINQYKMGILLEAALHTFSKDINNYLINSSIQVTLEAKKHGASIYEVLYQITTSKVLRNSLRVEEL